MGELSEDHQKYNRNAHIHIHIQSRKDPQLQKILKKTHMSHKYV